MASRINLPPLPKAVAPQKNEPSAANRAAPASTQSARFQAQRALDAFQSSGRSASTLAMLGGTPGTVMQSLAQTEVTVGPAPMTREERESAEQAITDAVDHDDASYIVEWLKAHPDPAVQAAFMDLLFAPPGDGLAGSILDDAGDLPPEDQALLSAALNAAWASGHVTAEELAEAVGPNGAGALPEETHEVLAGIIAGTGNPALIEAYAKRELELIDASETEDPQRAAAVATALAGLPPEALQAFLKNNPDAMKLVLQNINAGEQSASSPALGKLLDAAARIQPPTAESLQLFMDSIGQIGENPESRAAAARFFTQHGDAVLQSMMDGSGSLKAEDAGKLSEFFTRTLFTEPAYEGQEVFREAVMQQLGTLQQALEQSSGMDPMPEEAERQARMLGSLVGALEVGFLLAVDELKKRNDATKGMVDLFFSAKGLLPDLPIPGYGPLKDLTFKQIQEWVTNSLKEHPDDPEKAIPFHELFGEPITDPGLRTLYDSARLTALKNHDLNID